MNGEATFRSDQVKTLHDPYADSEDVEYEQEMEDLDNYNYDGYFDDIGDR